MLDCGRLGRVIALGCGLPMMCGGALGWAEDVALRARADQLLARARAANTVRESVAGIRTEAQFQATADDGTFQSGSYERLRALKTGGLRQDLRFGDWQATSIAVGNERARIGPWEFPPYAARRLLGMVPFTVGTLDGQDVVREIREGGSGAGEAALCIEFDTIRGEARSANEICVSKVDGTLLVVRDNDRVFTYSKYAIVAGSVYPGHVDYQEGPAFRLSADVRMSALDSLPEDAFAVPAGVRVGTLCRTAMPPIGRSVPQPAAKGPEGVAVIDVIVRVFVTSSGAVAQAHVVRPVRPDLDAEAMKLVGTWVFDPATCNGQANTVPIDLAVHFQGW